MFLIQRAGHVSASRSWFDGDLCTASGERECTLSVSTEFGDRAFLSSAAAADVYYQGLIDLLEVHRAGLLVSWPVGWCYRRACGVERAAHASSERSYT